MCVFYFIKVSILFLVYTKTDENVFNKVMNIFVFYLKLKM
ncbi:hypothetical protein JCM19300_4140 [Algibacter lectus]|uniref:Uncharacterized protein n=1 Tax=Algibacter lectus TaxID=221126 RepID=A0A090VCQ8_9FLAO|nr:hypothetical protein JCM19300_4140 [Algibacter lectus]